MRNIFLFIRRYFNFLVFLFLQGTSLYFISTYSKYHTAAFNNIRNQFVGSFSKRYAAVTGYFNLRLTNEKLMKANERLLNDQRSNILLPDTATLFYSDSAYHDTFQLPKKYLFQSATVLSNSVAEENNFMVLSKGKKDQLRTGMGVIDPNRGVVGIITEVSEDYAAVMSLLHRGESSISGKLLKTGETGSLSWDGKEANVVTLNKIPKGTKIAKGDTVITSGFSTTFPKGMLVGTVKAVYAEKSSNNYRIILNTSVNFNNLEYVFVIDNPRQEGVEQIIKKASKQF